MEGGLLCWELYIYVRHVNKGFGNGACLSLSPSLPLSLSPYRGSMSGTWWEGSYTEDSERHVSEGNRNRALEHFFYKAP